MKITSAAFVTVLLSLTCSHCTYADYVYQFAGTVTSVSSDLSTEFAVGETIGGRMRLSPSATSPNLATYRVDDFFANIGGDYPILSDGGVLKVRNDFGGNLDSVQLDITEPAHDLNAPSVSGHTPDYFVFNLNYGRDDLTSTDLLDQFIFSTPFDRSKLRFDVNDSIAVGFRLNDFSIVPEPDFSCLAMALCLLSPLSRQRRSRT